MLKGFLLTTVLLAAATPVVAQNLADVARAEEARRKAVKGQVKVYTNENLRGADGAEPPAPQPMPAAPPAAAPGTTAKPATPGTTKPVALSGAESLKDEKFWRDRLTAAREALKRSQTFADALQSQINGLYTEFVNMSDPAQRALIEQKRLAAIAEQDRVKADITKHTKALADIEDEARKANVPAGWLR
jgi:hypothetical protein